MLPILVTLLFAAAPDAPQFSVPFERYHLKNGLTVIFHRDTRLPTVAVELHFRVGSKDESKGRTGFAHLFEHLMFMGTPSVPNGKFDSILEGHGGMSNATTDFDRTNYFESGPKELLETFLWLDSDRLSNLPAAMTKEKVDLQRDVVKNERRESYENRPYGKLELILVDNLFPKDHPYHHPVIGSHADLSAASVNDVKQFFEKWYVPSNASLTLSGDFEPDTARALIEKYFGAMPRKPTPLSLSAATLPPLPKAIDVTTTDRVELPQVSFVWRSPKAYARQDAECEMLAMILGEGKSSRLYDALVVKRQIASEVEVEQASYQLAGWFRITVTSSSREAAPQISKALQEELAALSKDRPITRLEVQRARTQLQTHFVAELQSNLQVAEHLAEMEAFFGDPGLLQRNELNRFDAIEETSVQEAAHALFKEPRLTVTINPEKAPQTKAANVR